MELWRKLLVTSMGVAVAVPTLFIGNIYASAWYHRRRANQLLAVLKSVKPGMTTEAEYMRVVRPFEAVSDKLYVGGQTLPGVIELSNRPNWEGWLFERMQGRYFEILLAFDNLLSWRVIPPLVDFHVIPSFADGMLSELDIQESVAVGFHPPGAHVSWNAQLFESRNPRVYERFRGYEMSEEGISDQPPWVSFVTMDERATTEEHDRALDIRFHCFTKIAGCMEANQYSQPAPSRHRFEDSP